MREEISKTTSMRSLYLEISLILEKNGFMYIPIKGCDPRIYSGARDFFNVMEDVDILVKYTDIENIGGVLEESGYIYQGTFSGSHLNFITDEKIPRLIEIHWDLINRYNPIHRRLFRASIERIWERSSVLCAASHLSLEDLLSYLTVQCVTAYLMWYGTWERKGRDLPEDIYPEGFYITKSSGIYVRLLLPLLPRHYPVL